MPKPSRYTPNSPPPPKINTSKEVSIILSSILNEKNVPWPKVKNILQKSKCNIVDSLRRQALKRACLDPSVCSTTLKLLLKNGKPEITHCQRLKYAMMAVRCRNMRALETIIYDDVSVLYYSSTSISGFLSSDMRNGAEEFESNNTHINVCGGFEGDGSTLLHRACEKHGWNEQVAFILKETLENRNDDESTHEGMFQEMDLDGNDESIEVIEMPLKLSMQAGAELKQIVHHIRDEYPFHLERHLGPLMEIVAEYCYDMGVFRELLEYYPHMLNARDFYHPVKKTSPLHYACYFQNDEMIQILLEEYRKREGRKNLLQKRLLARDNEGMTPLGHLVLNVGDRDDGNAWTCIDLCIDFFERKRLQLLHIVLDQFWEEIVRKPNCMKIIKQIVVRLRVDLCDLDDKGRTVLSLLIANMVSTTGNNAISKGQDMPMQVLSYFLSLALNNERDFGVNPAFMLDNTGRLPLHLACKQNLSWEKGLKYLVQANASALNANDPITDLPPFALAAEGSDRDLDTVYLLLRHNPSQLRL